MKTSKSILLAATLGGLLCTPIVYAAGEKNTGTVREPAGYEVECFATNLEKVPRDMTATIYNFSGTDVTAWTSCGAKMAPGSTCHSGLTATDDDAIYRCKITTSGSSSKLVGSIRTYNGSMTEPTSATLPAM